ncbi:hypothetical protein [Meiothermus ruber]|uniref:Uncharacterized protein n=1 Tax=Meiothermus ruber (strain ATCC 35948 / DSM 1279 / VKM B-1258 / 21) TaxID=504728 RepID=D3PNE7_MEIRD|nr:hypothetical protein [Meiothermus ruber]ADD27338.1 hypothetical protein Mrub_0565 [Meiothermus ruber DSM 1279]AGK03794.1 hypothetical protein K649_02460 [Meiothermus ruber DSM 1279]
MISTAIWSSRIQAALGREPRSVQEALEGLRVVLKGDEVSKEEFFQAAREGERFERFSRDDQVALIVWAALKEALEKTRKRLDQETPSTLVVRKDDSVKEEVRGVKPVGTWKGPDRVYDVYLWDLKDTLRKGVQVRHPQYGSGYVQAVEGHTTTVRFACGTKKLHTRAVRSMVVRRDWEDRRVADAKGWLERFLASAEEVRGMSRLEREDELAGNPHFSEGIISEEVRGYLERAGYRVDPHNLEELASLVDSLPAREEKFKEGVLGITILRTRDGKAVGFRKPGLWETKVAPDAEQESFAALIEAQGAHTVLAEMLQGEGWSVSEVRAHLSKLAKALSPADAKRLFGLLQEIAALRRLKVELHRAGFSPVRAVAYRDSSGEVVYTAPVYG